MDIIEMDRDVKEYRPRKKPPVSDARFADNYNVSPKASAELMNGLGLDDAVGDLDSGVMLSTSEVIDFGEGTDSWTNEH